MRKMDCNNQNRCDVLERTAIKDLAPDLEAVLIVGIIIGKQRPRKFADPKAKENEAFRAVWNFTLRDSVRDYINVTYWDSCERINEADDKFYTGDVVEITRPRISIRKFNDIGEQFRPMVTSPYSLTLNEQSQILPHNGDTNIYKKLLRSPTKPITGFVPLRDIHSEGENMKERFVDILGAVRSVSAIRIVNTKHGQETQLREVVLFDHTSSGLKITIWDTDGITRAASWKPRTTIIFITDARIEWSKFHRSFSATLSNRSIVTENPIGEEALKLAEFAKNAPLATSAILDQLVTTIPDPDTIQNVMCVAQVLKKLQNLIKSGENTEERLTALLFVFVSKLDLDGISPVTIVKCGNCKNWLKNQTSLCENEECPVVLGNVPRVIDEAFDIKVDLSDQTGTLINCRLSGAIAERVLNCSIEEFLQMSDEQKQFLKWKLLMERCAVRIMVIFGNRRVPAISVISCTKADAREASERIPLYYKNSN